MPDYPLDPFDTAHWLDHPAPAEPEEGSQEVKVPNLWARPAGPTPGQTYAAYGDTGAMSGQTEGLSPAMKQMIRRNLGRRLSEQTMGERQQTAEQAMRGAGYVAPNPLVAAATSGVTSQFMGDTPGQTAARVASSLIPLAGGQAVRAGLQYAPRLTAGALTAGAAMLPDATESTAADTDPNPFKWDDAAAAQRRKMAERTASGMRDRAAAKYLTEFQAREDVQRADVQKKSADWIAAQSAAAKTGDALSAYKTSVAPSAGVLKSDIQNRIQNATSIEEASKVYSEAMSEHERQSRTFAENYPGLLGMEGLQIGSALIGGYGAYKTTSRRAAALEEATKDARTAYNARYGINVSREDIPHLDNDLALKTNILRETAGIPSFSKTELSLGLGVPWLAGVVGPNAIDAATSPNEDVRNRAMNNIIPGWNPGSGPGGRDWSALANMGRAGVEGLAMAGAGSYAGKVRKDYPLAAANARGVLGSVEGAKSAPPPPAGPPPSSPPSAAAPPAAPPGVPVGGPAPALQWQRPTFAPWLSGAAARSYYDKFMRENPEASTSAQPPLPPSPPIKNGKGRKSGTSFGRLAP